MSGGRHVLLMPAVIAMPEPLLGVLWKPFERVFQGSARNARGS